MAFGNEKFGNPLENQNISKKEKKELKKWKNTEREPDSTIKINRNGETEEIPAEGKKLTAARF